MCECVCARIRVSIRNMREGKFFRKVMFVERFVSTMFRENRSTAVGTVAYVSLYVCMYVK